MAASYSEQFNRELNPETEILVTAGANEGMFATFAGFLDEGDEVICMEPFFDQYIVSIIINITHARAKRSQLFFFFYMASLI